MFVAFEAVRVSRNPNLNPVKFSTKDISQLVQPKMKYWLFRVNLIGSARLGGIIKILQSDSEEIRSKAGIIVPKILKQKLSKQP